MTPASRKVRLGRNILLGLAALVLLTAAGLMIAMWSS
jgi:hypothetical protein